MGTIQSITMIRSVFFILVCVVFLMLSCEGNRVRPVIISHPHLGHGPVILPHPHLGHGPVIFPHPHLGPGPVILPQPLLGPAPAILRQPRLSPVPVILPQPHLEPVPVILPQPHPHPGPVILPQPFRPRCPGPHNFWNPCGSNCPPTCGRPIPGVCNRACVPRCDCKPGFFRRFDGACVRQRDCYRKYY